MDLAQTKMMIRDLGARSGINLGLSFSYAELPSTEGVKSSHNSQFLLVQNKTQVKSPAKKDGQVLI